jgi:Pvc16 N-terminal domain
MAIGVSNLWDITDELMQLLNANKGGASFTVTDRSPDEVRGLPDGTYISLYLFHIAPDKFQRNALPVAPAPGVDRATRALRAPYQPLSLELYYFLSAYAKGTSASQQEQQAMTAALKCFHEHPIVTATVSADNHSVEFVLSLEPETADSVGRLWLAVSSSLRLAVVYKASIVLVEPPVPPVQSKKPQIINLAVSPASLPFAQTGQVISTDIRVSYVAPGNIPHDYELFPAVVAPGQNFTLYGAGLNQPGSDRLYLLLPDGTEQDVTTWAFQVTEAKFSLTMPPTGFPAAGIYQLRVGNGVVIATLGAIRSNATPFSVAAGVDPTGGPILSPGGSTYRLNGRGFSPGSSVEVLLETVPLQAGGAVAPGQFVVNGPGTEIQFQLPGTLPNGVYGVRVRVNQVESTPAMWVVKS